MNLLMSISHIVSAYTFVRKLLVDVAKTLEHPSMLEDSFSLWLIELRFPLIFAQFTLDLS
jgi:hypothetical protein